MGRLSAGLHRHFWRLLLAITLGSVAGVQEKLHVKGFEPISSFPLHTLLSPVPDLKHSFYTTSTTSKPSAFNTHHFKPCGLPSPSRPYSIHRNYHNTATATMVNNAFLDTAVPASKDIPRMVLGIVELLTFFPNHTQWFQFMKRALRNKWSTEEMARIQLHARGQLTQDNVKTREAAMRHQVGVGGKAFYNNKTWTRTTWFASSHPDSLEFVNSPPASGNNLDLYDISRDTPAWGPNSGNLSAALPTLYEVVDGVVNWPQGQDRGQLTQALDWAVQQGEQYLRSHNISEIPNIIATQSFRHPTNAGTPAWDARARTRMNQSVRKPAT